MTRPDSIEFPRTPTPAQLDAIAWTNFVVHIATGAVQAAQDVWGDDGAAGTMMLLDPWVERTLVNLKQSLEN